MASKALHMPEILASILRFTEFTTLCAAAQVNSLWAEEATNRIWRGQYRQGSENLSGPLKGLARLPSERRLWYTSKIRHLVLGHCDDFREELKIENLLSEETFSFPNLRSVIVDLGSDRMKEKHMTQFLSPNLVSLELFGGYYTPWYLEMIKARSPRLQRFLMDNASGEDATEPPIPALSFIDFLESMPSITHLELHTGWNALLNNSCLRYLMLRPNLEMLSLGHEMILDWNLIEGALYDCGESTIFPSLRLFDVYAEGRVLQTLIPLLKTLQGAHLLQTDSHTGGISVLSLLSLCRRLEDILFDSNERTIIPSKSFRDLAAGCPLLRRLELGESCEPCGEFNDELIAAIAPQLSLLAVLCLPFKTKISPKSLACLSLHCPYLQELELKHDFELMDKPDPSDGLVYFPRLEILELGSVSHRIHPHSDPTTIATAIIELIDSWCPALKAFACVDPFPRLDLPEFHFMIAKHLAATRPPLIHPRNWPGSSISTNLIIEIVGY